MKKTIVGLISVVILFSTLPVKNLLAEIRPNAFTLSPVGGYYVFEGNQNIKDSLFFGLGLGYDFTERWGFEGVFNYINTESSSPDLDARALIYRLDGLYHFRPGKRLVPFLFAGAGTISLDLDRIGPDTDPLFNYGVGLKYFLSDSIALRSDARHIISFSETHNNLSCTLGLTFLFGGERKKEIPPVDESVSPQTDIAVDKQESPPEIEAEEHPVSPVPFEEKVFILEFEKDMTGLRPEYQDLLKEIADLMQAHPETSALIKGYTDSWGSADYNLRLSQRRADNIKLHLVRYLGIAPSRIHTQGLGKEGPVADNQTEEGRQKNRRAVVILSAEIIPSAETLPGSR